MAVAARSWRTTNVRTATPRTRADSRRTRGVTVVLVILVLAVAIVALTTGPIALPLDQLVSTLFGTSGGSGDFVVWRLRMPRLVMALLAGAAFGIAGALFQTLLRNPLASPDIIGISGGASAAAAAGILFFGVSGSVVSLVAFGGAMLVALAIYLLAWRGGVSGYRFVLIGIGFAFMANAVISFLITRGDVREVGQALAWTVGSVGTPDWTSIAVLAVALLILLPLVALLVPRLRALQLGDDQAAGLGVPVEPSRLLVLVVAVALVAAATAFVGPVVFVAFVSAPIARRMLGTGSLALVQSALVGAFIVLAADQVAQNIPVGTSELPAGIITGIIGAPYLLWLMVTASRRGGTA